MIKLAALTDVGMVRDHNEDNFSVIQNVAPFTPWDYDSGGFEISDAGLMIMVADGMGGANAGEIASSIAVKIVEDEFRNLDVIPAEANERELFLRKSIIKAKKAIVKESRNNIDYKGMGTTAIVAWINGDNCHLAWAGDSRAYLQRKDAPLEIVSRDHSLVWELMEKGMLTEIEAETHPDSNIITQSLSDSGTKLKPDTKTIKLAEGDKLLLCSDGLNGTVEKQMISEILATNQGADCCRLLVENANANGGHDNTTVVLFENSPFWDDGVQINQKTEVDEEDTEAVSKTIKITEEESKPENEIIATVVSEEKKSKKAGFFSRIWKKFTEVEDNAVPDVVDEEVKKTEIEDSANKNNDDK